MIRHMQPVAIGGIGGSGTRVIASVLRSCGYYLGDDLNTADDNLWFTLLFKRVELMPTEAHDADITWSIRVFGASMGRREWWDESMQTPLLKLAATARGPHSPDWLTKRVESLLRAVRSDPISGPWGWKEPNTHMFVDSIHRRLDGFRYIHVLRNGLNMAFSSNQYQLLHWGPAFLGRDFALTPRASLKYWCVATRRTLHAMSAMGDRGLVLWFDRLCEAPEREITRLLQFLGSEASARTVESLAAGVAPPPSLNRHVARDCRGFDPDDVAYAQLAWDETR